MRRKERKNLAKDNNNLMNVLGALDEALAKKDSDILLFQYRVEDLERKLKEAENRALDLEQKLAECKNKKGEVA